MTITAIAPRLRIQVDSLKVSRLGFVFPILVFLLVTVFLTYPIPFHLGSMVIGRPFEDAFESIWYLHWYKHAIIDLTSSPLFQPDIFVPVGWDLGFAVLPPIYPALLAPLTALVGPVAAYNLALIGACVFAAYGVFRLSKTVGASTWGGIIAGVAYAFYPNRQVYLGGFLNLLLASMWLPWVLYALIRAVRSPKARTRWMLFFGLAFSLSIVGAWQFVFIATGVVLVFGAVFFFRCPTSKWESWLHPVAISLLVVALIAGPVFLNGFLVRDRMGASAVFTLADLEGTAVSVERLFAPSALNPLVEDVARNTIPLTNGEDGVVNFGLVPVLLAVVALWRLRPWNDSTRGFVALPLVGVLLMLGPTLRFWGKPVTVSVPGASFVERVAPSLIMADGSLKIPLPALALYRFFPPFRSFHHFGRWGLVASLGLAVLAALGFTLVTKRFRRSVHSTLGMLVMLILIVEFNSQPLPNVTSTEQMRRSVDSWLASQPGRSVIIEYPLDYTMRAQSLYYTIFHKQRTVHGSAILPSGFAKILPTLELWPEEVALDMLEDIGVRYVLVHSFKGQDFEGQSLPRLQNISRLRLIERFPTSVGPVDSTYLFELVASRSSGDQPGAHD